ncbi:MAG: PIN domain-containing protein [Ginsengibacter sp.]
MKDKYFIDSNILIYAHTMQDEKKKAIAHQILSLNQEVLLNTQVINESINVFIKRFNISFVQIQKIVEEIIYYLPVRAIDEIRLGWLGLKIHNKYHYSYYDALIISSAVQNECSVLYSEDLHHNQKIENTLTIINPFL